MLCMGVTFVRKNSCLAARIVPFDTVGLHLLIFRILEPHPSKDIAFDLSQVPKYNDNIVVKYVFSMSCCGKDFSKPSCEA